MNYVLSEFLIGRLDRIRTRTKRALNALPLPLGYEPLITGVIATRLPDSDQDISVPDCRTCPVKED